MFITRAATHADLPASQARLGCYLITHPPCFKAARPDARLPTHLVICTCTYTLRTHQHVCTNGNDLKTSSSIIIFSTEPTPGDFLSDLGGLWLLRPLLILLLLLLLLRLWRSLLLRSSFLLLLLLLGNFFFVEFQECRSEGFEFGYVADFDLR